MISWTAVASDSTGSILDVDRLEEARLLMRLAIEFRRDGWPDKARRYARRALSIFERVSPTDLDLVRAVLCLAGARADLKDYQRAQQEFQRAEDALNRQPATSGLDVQALRLQTMREVAGVLLALGDSRQAEAVLTKALGVAQQAFGADHPEVGAVLHALGLLFARAGLHKEASRLEHLALAIIEKGLGSQHPQVADILHHLGLLEHARGRSAVGEAFTRRAAVIRQGAFGPDHPQVATALASIGMLLEEQQRHLEATLYHTRARVILERWRGRARKAPAGSRASGLRMVPTPAPDARYA